MGALASGSAAAVGSGAFTTGSLEGRHADIDVVNDNAGVLRLVDMMPDSDVVAEDEEGRLRIDFTAGGASGVNTGGKFQLGGVPEPAAIGDGVLDSEANDPGGFDFIDQSTSPNAAFGIENRATQTYDLELEYDASESDGLGDAKLHVYVYNGGAFGYPSEDNLEYKDSPSFTIEDGNETDSVVIDDSVPDIRQFYGNDGGGGKRIFVSMLVDTTEVEDPDDVDLTGEISLTADNARPDPR